jgi:nitroimidazol reductase NimA-like FMN-containing flavoprotein (pyridoxamine 5'-phosphate oxidase superfamily)
MIEIRDLNSQEIEEFVSRSNYGHMACCDDGAPYIVPIHFAYSDGYIYVYTTQGKKWRIISKNPRICVQIEDVKDNKNWTSVVVDGEAQELTEEAERRLAVDAVVKINPTLTPAVSVHWMDNWVRENIEVVFRITPLEMTGRASVPQSDSGTPFVHSKLPSASRS